MTNIFDSIQNIFTSSSKKKKPNTLSVNREQFANAAIVGNSRFINSYGDLGLSAIYSAIAMIGNSIACMPIDVYKLDGKNNKKYVYNEISRLLNLEPSKYYTPFIFLKTLIVHYYVYGSAYVKICREGGKVVELLILNPSMVTKNIEPNTGEIQYIVSGVEGYYSNEDIIHIVNHTTNGITGLATLDVAKNTIEAYKCQENHSLSYHKGGANFAGVITPNIALNGAGLAVDFTDEQAQAVATGIRAATDPNTGMPNGLVVLSSDVKYQKIAQDPNAFIIESRKFSIQEIARFFNINPILLGDLTHANYANSEQARLSLLSDTLAPIITQIQQEFRRKLFIGSLADKYILKFDLLRFSSVDLTTLSNICSKFVKDGIMTINEARDVLDYDKSDEEIANKLLIQSNNISTAEGLIAKEKFDTNQPLKNNTIEDIKNKDFNNE